MQRIKTVNINLSEEVFAEITSDTISVEATFKEIYLFLKSNLDSIVKTKEGMTPQSITLLLGYEEEEIDESTK